MGVDDEYTGEIGELFLLEYLFALLLCDVGFNASVDGSFDVVCRVASWNCFAFWAAMCA